jgi:replicative DNA helicase
MSEKIIDTLKKFGHDFQVKCIIGLVNDRTLIERLSDIIDPTSFENDAHQWIVKETLKYFIDKKDLPTMTVFKVRVEQIENELLKKSVIDQLKLVYTKQSESDLAFVKEQYLEFCKNQKIKTAILDSVEHLKIGNYEHIKHSIDEALKAGMERNVGHDYFNEVEKRMSIMARDSVKTNWSEIDTLMDGGLAKGELGIIVAPAGIGKCVGPNTEIEIQYAETGIPIKGNSGKEYILWIKPFDKFEFDGKILFGWQIDNIFFEIEKMKQVINKCDLVESENIQKK